MSTKPIVYCLIATSVVTPLFVHEHLDDLPHLHFNTAPVSPSATIVGTASLASPNSIYFIGTTTP
ncbi:MAG TPA: hypothetical protein VJ327_02385 [Patescibacteria group bacterium]|nr:hypothetical protein [Patescibacteria group bacterium]